MNAPKHADRTQLEQMVRDVERALTAGTQVPSATIEALRAHATNVEQSTEGGLTRRLTRRIDDVLARHALRTRILPAASLDGMADRVVSAVHGERSGRARMTTAFLEAPSTLGRWRVLALASTACLVVGFVWLGMREPAPSGQGSEPRALRAMNEDPRSRLLDPYTPFAGSASDATPLTQPASNDTQDVVPLPDDLNWGVFHIQGIDGQRRSIGVPVFIGHPAVMQQRGRRALVPRSPLPPATPERN